MESTGMSVAEYAAIKDLENQKGNGWGATTALWVLVAAVIIFAIVYNWTKNCNEKVQFSTALANLNGRVSCIEPDIRWAGQQLYAANGVISATVQGVGDMKQNFGNQLFQLSKEIFYGDECCGRGRGRGRGCCGDGNREFRQSSTYNLASTNVTVDETCRN